jgi:protease PrsW
MGLILSLFTGIFPMLLFAYFVYWLDRYEKEPKLLLGGVFLWGAVVASAGAFLINTLFGIGIYSITGSEPVTMFATGSLVAPFVEESLKGFAVLVVFLLLRREFDSFLDGIVYASIAALGFAATENVYYIYTYGYLEDGWRGLAFLVFVRVVLVGWQHPFYSSFTGIGLAAARLDSRFWVRLLAPFLGWSAGVLAHSLHNTLAGMISGPAGLLTGALWDWSGWLLMFIFILFVLYREQQGLILHLKEEADLGWITLEQYRTACSAWSQSRARLSSLLSGQFGTTSRFYQVCGELAHKKSQFQKFGDERGNEQIIGNLREELKTLSPRVFPQALRK